MRSARVDVTRNNADLGRWRAAQRFAEPRLRAYVNGYFASKAFLPEPLYERHMPSLEVVMA